MSTKNDEGQSGTIFSANSGTNNAKQNTEVSQMTFPQER
jgi:hypothetical protein